MRERGAERQRGPGQLRIVVQLRFERNKLHTPGYVSQTLFPFLCSQTITLRVSRPFLQLSPATAAIVMFGMSIWNLSSLSFPSFSFYSKTQPPEQNNCQFSMLRSRKIEVWLAFTLLLQLFGFAKEACLLYVNSLFFN